MNGKCLYFAIAAMLAVLSILIQFLPFFVLTLIYVYLIHRYKQFTALQFIAIAAVVLIFLLIGHKAAVNNKSIIPETSASFHLQYIQDPKIDGDLLQVLAEDTRYKEQLLIRYQIKSVQEKTALENSSFYNRRCWVSGTLEKPKIAKNPDGFNYRTYLAEKQIYWIVDSEENPLHTCSALKPSPAVLIKQLRFSGVHYLEKHFPPEISSLSAALIFGDRSMLEPELLGNYQKTGIVHLIAISGLQVSLLLGMIFYLGIRIGFTRQAMGNFLLAILPVYGILTGSSPSVIRTCLMAFFVLMAAKWKNRLKLLSVDAISLTFMIYLAWKPFIIFDTGFQLSFSVSLAIILSARHILNGCQGKIAQMLTTSVIAQLAALPFLLYYYFQMPLIGLLANMLYIPLFSFIYVPGFYLLFLLQFVFGYTPPLLNAIVIKIVNLSNLLIGFFSRFSLAATPGKPNLLFLIIYILLILTIFYFWETKYQPKWKTYLIVFSFLLFTLQPGWNWLNPFGEVTTIDVGQGDSIFIHLPFGQGDYLIDTGGTVSYSEEKWKQRARPFEVGRDVVVPYLKAKGISKIDKLILTHGDMDHIGGAFSIIKEFKVKEVLLPDVAETSETELEIMKVAKLKGIPVIKGTSGMHWESGENRFYVISPEKNFIGERNSGSLTIYAQIGRLTWFFGGDLDRAGEERIIKRFPKLTVDVLKVGHHGSKTSSSPLLIKQIKPRIALISVGEKNRFGHPHQEVLQLLEKENTLIYRTDLQGAITYRFFRGRGTFSAYLQ